MEDWFRLVNMLRRMLSEGRTKLMYSVGDCPLKYFITAFASRILCIAESGWILIGIFSNLVYRPVTIPNRISHPCGRYAVEIQKTGKKKTCKSSAYRSRIVCNSLKMIYLWR